MIINEARFAAAYVTKQGTTRRFDDIGDMLFFYATHAEDVAVFWVHDYETASWLHAAPAYFVMSKAIHTPMAHGVVAVSAKERAQALAGQTQGEVLTFAELHQRFSTAGTASQLEQHHHGPVTTPQSFYEPHRHPRKETS
jgi:copper chaperone NosL